MDKLEKVTKGLECCQKKVCIYDDTLKECPYWELCGRHEDAFEDCTKVLAKDALALLKSQESGKVNITITQSDGWKEGNCPFCGMKVDSFYNWSFCGTCGRGLKWR